MFEWYSLFPYRLYPPKQHALPKIFAAVSTPLPWGPPIIQFISFAHKTSHLEKAMSLTLSASSTTIAHTADATIRFPAIGTDTFTFINRIAALLALHLIVRFFQNPHRSIY